MTDERSQSYRKYERVNLSQNQEQEMILRYGTTNDPITVIAARYGVHNTYPYRILSKWNVDWRRDSGVPFMDWVKQHERIDILPNAEPAVPESAIARDIRNLASAPPDLRHTTPTVRRAPTPSGRERHEVAAPGVTEKLDALAPEPFVDAAAEAVVARQREVRDAKLDAVFGDADDLRGQAWHIEFLPQSVLVRASSIENALAKARARYPGLTIGAIRIAESGT